MYLYQCNPPIPVQTTKGKGYCIAWIDYSQEHETLWKVILNDSGQVWDVPQSQIRGQTNYSMERVTPEKL